MAALSREKEACQQIVSRQGLGLASTGDAAAELRASLSSRQREIGTLQASLAKRTTNSHNLRSDNDRLVPVLKFSKGTEWKNWNLRWTY